MNVFLSYSDADKKVAEELRKELTALAPGQNLTISSDSGQPDADRHQRVEERIEKAVRSADDILVLVGPKSKYDTAQQLTWRVALEAVWKDPHKRLIPVLLKEAPLPRFVYGDSSGDDTLVVRIRNLRKLRSAAQAILIALERDRPIPADSRRSPEPETDTRTKPGDYGTQHEKSFDPETEPGTKPGGYGVPPEGHFDPETDPGTMPGGYGIPDEPEPPDVELQPKSAYRAEIDAERDRRLQEIKEFARSLKR